MESPSLAKVVSGVGMAGCAYFGFRFVNSCLKGREESRLTDGVVFGSKVYMKAATGATAVLVGAKLWEVLPRVVPSGVVMLLTPVPFVIHALKCKETIFTTLRNNEFGMLPLAGFTLFGYSSGRIITLLSKLGLVKPMVLVTYSVLFGHILALNIGESVTEILLSCAPISMCITSALAPKVIGMENFNSFGEIMLQGQVLLSTMLVSHTWWSVELGNPIQFDVNNHAVLVTGCGVYTSWCVVRIFFRIAGRVVRKTKRFEKLFPKSKKETFVSKNFTNIITTAILAGGFVVFEPLLGRVLSVKQGKITISAE